MLPKPSQEIGEIVAGVLSIEVNEPAWGQTNLDLFIDRPARAKFKLMRAPDPGNIVANLVIVGFVMPRPAPYVVVGASARADGGNAIQVVTGEAPEYSGCWAACKCRSAIIKACCRGH